MCGLRLLLPIVLWQTAALAPQPAADKEEVDNNNNSLANHQQPSPAVLWNSKWPQFCPDTIATDRRADLLRSFGIAINTNAGFWGTGVNDPINTMGAFGLWPHFLPGTGAPFNGGLPQKGNLTLHLQRVRADITRYMPHPDYTGHAVVDFENWAPAFDANNFGARGVVAADYQKLSRDDVRRRHPRWSAAEIEALARNEFDTAARKFFKETLLLGKAMRPHASWGFYGFPSCGKWTHGRECPSGWIYKGAARTAAPVLMVKKPNADLKAEIKWRVCIDYRKMNAVIRKRAMDLPDVPGTIHTIREQACESYRQVIANQNDSRTSIHTDLPQRAAKSKDPGKSYLTVTDICLN